MRQSGGTLHLVDDRIKCAIRVLWGTEIAQASVGLSGEAFHKRGGEPRFADPRLTGDQDHLTFAGLCPGPAPQQQFRLFLPADEAGQSACAQRLKTALHGTRPQRRPGLRRPGDPLEFLRPEVLQFKEVADKASRAPGDDDRIRRGDPLQACGQIRRLANDPAFLGFPGANKITDNDQARRDPDAHLERILGAQLADRFDERQPRPHRALGVILMRARIAEIDQHPIAHVLGHEAVEPGDRLSDALVIGADHGTHVLGVELGRERRRADEINEHDR